jgi:hypothetical protein
VIQWQKSSFSGGGDGNECVELTQSHDALLLRESDDPGRILRVAASSLAAVVQWQKSTFSSGSDGSSCVELAHTDALLLLRESDAPARILPLTPPPSPPSSTTCASHTPTSTEETTSGFMGKHSSHPCFLQASYLPSGHDGKRNSERVAGTIA